MRRASLGRGLHGLVAAMWMLAGAASAQSWPVKPVRYIVPFPPAGSPDIIARIGTLINEPAARVIDVKGAVVAPGFVDIHTHAIPANRAFVRETRVKNFFVIGASR